MDWQAAGTLALAAVVAARGIYEVIRRARTEDRTADSGETLASARVTEAASALVDRLEKRLDEMDEERAKDRAEIRALSVMVDTLTTGLASCNDIVAELRRVHDQATRAQDSADAAQGTADTALDEVRNGTNGV